MPCEATHDCYSSSKRAKSAKTHRRSCLRVTRGGWLIDLSSCFPTVQYLPYHLIDCQSIHHTKKIRASGLDLDSFDRQHTHPSVDLLSASHVRRLRGGHSTICQPDDSHTFGRTFGGRPARPTRATMAAKIQIAAATCRTKAISRAGVGELRHETNQVLPTSW